MGVDRLHQNVAIWGTPDRVKGTRSESELSDWSCELRAEICPKLPWENLGPKNGKEWKKGNSEFR